MIIPSKNKALRYSLLGIGSKVISELKSPQTVSSLWEKVSSFEGINNFENYILLLDFLYMVGLINLDMGLITFNTTSINLLEFGSFSFINFETESPDFKELNNFSELCEVFGK